MDNLRLNQRTDEQLLGVMDETGDWAVNDRRGRILYVAASLRDAVREAMVYAAASKHAVEIYRHPGEEVIVFRDQIEAISNLIGDGL